MANATDNLYVNIIANTQGFTNKIKEATKPFREFMQVVQSIMALGGAAVVLSRIARSMGEMEKAYAKLYPESQKAYGSLKSWNDAMVTMKAEGGSVVAKVLTPIRAALLDIIDPANRAKAALQEVTDLTSGWGKYTSADTKYKNEIALAKQALEDARKAAKEIASQMMEYQRMQAQLGKRPEFGALTLKYQEAGYDSSAAQAQASKDILNYDQTLKFLSDTLRRLKTDLDNANTAIIEIPKWLKENEKGTAAGTVALTGYAEASSETFDVMQDYNDQLERSVELMAQLHTGTKTAAEETRKLGRAMASAPAAGTKSGSKGKVHRVSSFRKSADEVADLTEEWQRYAEVMQIIATSMGEAFASGDYVAALRQMTTALLNFIAKEAIAAALRVIRDHGTAGIPLAAALLALGGVALVAGSALGASGGGGAATHGGIEAPRMAAGGIVTRPTLAMIGEAGPEAVVPLGRGGVGTTIIVQGSIWQTEDLARAVADRMSRW